MCGDSTENHKVLGQRLNKSQGARPKSRSGISVSVMKCSNCGLIYSQPQPVPFDIQQHYGMPPEDYWRPEKFHVEDDYFSREIGIVKELLGFREGMAGLDIGAGLGQMMVALERAGFDMYGIEPSAPFYERALSDMKIDPKKLQFSTIEDAEFEDGSFDFVTYGAVFEHLYHPVESLEKVLRWLKPNGIVYIEVPSSDYFMSKVLNSYFKLARTSYVTHLSPMHPPFHLFEFTLRSFEELQKKLNFRIDKYYYEVCDIYFVPKIAHPLLRKYMKMTNTGMQLMVYLRKTG